MEEILNEKYSAEYNEELRGLVSEIESVKDELFLKLINVAVNGPLKEWSENQIEDDSIEFPINQLENCDDPFVSRICKICKQMDELVEDAQRHLSFCKVDKMDNFHKFYADLEAGKNVYLKNLTEDDALIKMTPDKKTFIKWKGQEEKEVDTRKSNVAGEALVTMVFVTEEEYENF